MARKETPVEKHTERAKRMASRFESDARHLAHEAQALEIVLRNWKHKEVRLPGIYNLGTNLTNRIKVAVEEELESVLERMDAMEIP